ncbi:ATP-binding protein [Frankia sp. Cppng1_Ct_nod]|uniref:ATP-binding protein n=1 Tax=Frankia sp. Cppng1_Ct_nod TaxID=2897162 RepID=UPI00104101DA|nr:ATP-binding protein [Frankia sp. Cppng1_Ct_nod]
MPTVELRFAALPGHVRTARMIVAAISRRSGVPDEILDEIKLAVGEACARAVTVNRQFDPMAPVVVRVSNDDSFAVSVVDCGPAGQYLGRAYDGGRGSPSDLLPDLGSIQSSALKPRDDDTSPPLPAGLGLALIEGLVDDFDITAQPDSAGTVVTMRWSVKEKVDSPIVAV